MKKRKRFKNASDRVFGHIENPITFKINSIAEKTEEADSFENEEVSEKKEKTSKINPQKIV